jgi:metallo-beta-lactamase family protein
MKMFDNGKNLLCIVGWQPPESLGRRLVEGEKTVLVRYRDRGKIKKDWISPLIQIREFHSFSGHADQNTLLDWVGSIKGVRKVFLVHGEVDQAKVLAEKIDNRFGTEVVIPPLGKRVTLSMD